MRNYLQGLCLRPFQYPAWMVVCLLEVTRVLRHEDAHLCPVRKRVSGWSNGKDNTHALIRKRRAVIQQEQMLETNPLQQIPIV